jgi:hypothetical protein
MLKVDDRTANYISTICKAAQQGTVCPDGMEVICLVMRGYTLDAAKQQQRENEAHAVRLASLRKS